MECSGNAAPAECADGGSGGGGGGGAGGNGGGGGGGGFGADVGVGAGGIGSPPTVDDAPADVKLVLFAPERTCSISFRSCAFTARRPAV